LGVFELNLKEEKENIQKGKMLSLQNGSYESVAAGFFFFWGGVVAILCEDEIQPFLLYTLSLLL
jgi:hypothetical protein